MHGVAFGGAGLVNDALEEAADGGVGERALIGGLGILQHFLFAFRLIKREVGRLFEPANFEGTTRALVQELDELLERALALCPDRKSTRLNSSHVRISYAVFCLKKKNTYSFTAQTHGLCST